jgi:hypothetical protein
MRPLWNGAMKLKNDLLAACPTLLLCNAVCELCSDEIIVLSTLCTTARPRCLGVGFV